MSHPTMVILKRRWPALAVVLGALLILASSFALLGKHPTPADRTAGLPSPASIISPDPTQSPVPGVTPSPLAAPPDGMRIQSPELGIDLPVVPGDGYNAPLFKAVLYPFLPNPGMGQRSMIYAHARPGMFGPLFNTRVGEHINILRPGQPTLHYVITQYNGHWPTTDLSVLQPLAQEQLVLVTCTTYNVNDPRQVVIADPV
ncbi:MAG: sortase [Candidatus Dormibacteria bacterium]